MLAVPPALLDILRLQSGSTVGLAIDAGEFVVTPTKRSRYSFDELLSQCNPMARRTREEREWLDGKRAGGELI